MVSLDASQKSLLLQVKNHKQNLDQAGTGLDFLQKSDIVEIKQMPLVVVEGVAADSFRIWHPRRRPEPCFVRTMQVDRRIAFTADHFDLPPSTLFPVGHSPCLSQEDPAHI